MFGAALLVDEQGRHLVRPFAALSEEKSSLLVSRFLSEVAKERARKGRISTEIGDFFFQESGQLYIAVVGDDAEESDRAFEGIGMVEEGMHAILGNDASLANCGPEMAEVIYLIDEAFTSLGAIERTPEEVGKMVRMESNDETLHEMVERNKEKERAKMEKTRKARLPEMEEISKEIEKIRGLESDLRSANIKEITSMLAQEPKAPKRERAEVSERIRELVEDASEKVNFIILERVRFTIDVSNNPKEVEVSAELLVKVMDEECARIRVELSKKPETARTHPAIDKKSFLENALLPKRELPLNRSLTLLKWSREKVDIPIEVTFWQNEVEEERYDFSIEVLSKSSAINSLVLSVPVDRVSDIAVHSEGYVDKDRERVVFEIKDLPAKESTSLEFSGLCDDPHTLFPMEIDYITKEGRDSELDICISKVLSLGDLQEEPREVADYSLIKITEGEGAVVVSGKLL